MRFHVNETLAQRGVLQLQDPSIGTLQFAAALHRRSRTDNQLLVISHFGYEHRPNTNLLFRVEIFGRLSTSRSLEPMRVIEVSMEQRWNEGAEETGDPRENPLTNGIVQHDSHMRRSGVTRPGIEPG
ncbi:hypothetical protein PR048_006505 [Dryococelus australis]|uniref:Uncharacterized protein n=1 Tax=Dryococelus australis TaxID=614101 RepID=A0ABQ9ICC9_9NEOP|nr:hypothetical protein PR048_006505 [Dryococelus australis]